MLIDKLNHFIVEPSYVIIKGLFSLNRTQGSHSTLRFFAATNIDKISPTQHTELNLETVRRGSYRIR